MQKRKGRIREFERSSREVGLEEAREERKGRREQAREKQNTKNKKKIIARDQKKKLKINKVRLIIAAIAIVVIAVVAMSIKDIINLKAEQKQLQKQNAILLEQRAELKDELKNIDNLDYIEEQARIQLKLIKPGEILYIIDKEDTSSEKN